MNQYIVCVKNNYTEINMLSQRPIKFFYLITDRRSFIYLVTLWSPHIFLALIKWCILISNLNLFHEWHFPNGHIFLSIPLFPWWFCFSSLFFSSLLSSLLRHSSPLPPHFRRNVHILHLSREKGRVIWCSPYLEHSTSWDELSQKWDWSGIPLDSKDWIRCEKNV